MTDGDDRRTQCVSGQLKVAEIRAMVLNSGTLQEEEVRWQRTDTYGPPRRRRWCWASF